MTETKPEPFWARCGDTTPRDWRNIKRVMWARTPAADAGDLVVVMAAFYTLGSLISWKQYR